MVEIEQKVDELRDRINEHERLLREIFDGSSQPVSGAFENWVSSEGSRAYQGKHVAFLEGKGVIAFADSLDELSDRLRTERVEGDLIIGFVPAPSLISMLY
jgi:hypothetical protein